MMKGCPPRKRKLTLLIFPESAVLERCLDQRLVSIFKTTKHDTSTLEYSPVKIKKKKRKTYHSPTITHNYYHLAGLVATQTGPR